MEKWEGPEISVKGVKLRLLPQKVVFIPEEKTLLVADLHLGKINHFRRAGIPVPQHANQKTLETFVDLLNITKPKRTLFLGDLFHSHYNDAWEEVGQIIRHFSSCSFELVKGNHDIMSDVQYQRHKMKVYDRLKLGPLLLTHEPVETDDGYNVSGHIHPAVRLQGKGRQSLMLPCFYFGRERALLPAFGLFTGLARIAVKKDDDVYVITERKVIRLGDE